MVGHLVGIFFLLPIEFVVAYSLYRSINSNNVKTFQCGLLLFIAYAFLVYYVSYCFPFEFVICIYILKSFIGLLFLKDYYFIKVFY